MTSQQSYYVPSSSKWPIIATLSVTLTFIGIATVLLYETSIVPTIVLLVGVVGLLYMVFGWFANIISESMGGLYGSQMDMSFRWGMLWFIVSEALFFAAFFFSLWYIREAALPWLNGEGRVLVDNTVNWTEFIYQWPLLNNPNPEIVGPTATIEPLGLPFVNTILLVTSSVTVTFAHNALKLGQRSLCIFNMVLTVLLGALFLYFQGLEYIEAYQHLGLTLDSGIYGSLFFILTGFHGLHVTLGTIMLLVITLRIIKGHFSKENHFGFEAVSWYWHFVDVVWIGLFIFVYLV